MTKRVRSLDYYGYVEQPRCDVKDDGLGDVVEQQGKNMEKISEMERVDEEYGEKINSIESGIASVSEAMEEVTASIETMSASITQLTSELNALKEIVAKTDPSVTYEITADNFSASKMYKNGTQKLMTDVDKRGSNITFPVSSTGNTIWNLNGHTLTLGRQNYGAVIVRGAKELTIKGNGTLQSVVDNPLIWCAGAGCVVNIKGTVRTNFISNNGNSECVYCESGTINITGGVFMASGVTSSKYLLNCKDSNYNNGTAKIVVTGGKFYGFDPKDNEAEGEHTSFMAEGYTTVESTEVVDGNEVLVYTAKKIS